VRSNSESERYVLCPDCIVIECRRGESLILLGREEDWYSEGHTTFECYQCGETVSLADSLDEGRGPDLIGGSDKGFDEENMSVRDLIRSLKASGQ
jgi:hypothetical protein